MDLEYEDAGGDGHRCPDTGEEKTSCRVPVKEEFLAQALRILKPIDVVNELT